MIDKIFYFAGAILIFSLVFLIFIIALSKAYKYFRINISKKTPVWSGFYNVWIARKRLMKSQSRMAMIIAQLKEKSAPDELLEIANNHRSKINDSIDNCQNALTGFLGNNSVDGILESWDKQQMRIREKAKPIDDDK